MKQVLLVTYVDFWNIHAGSSSRVSSLIHHLRKISRLTIVFAGRVQEKDFLIIGEEYNNVNFVCLEPNLPLSFAQYVQRFSDFMSGKYFHVAILEYIEMFQILHLFPPDTITILDTNDILSDKINTFKQNHINYQGLVVTYEEEIAIFSKFDYIILINSDDFEKIKKDVPVDKLVLIPHPVDFPKSDVRKTVGSISFVASSYAPNIVAMRWFLSEVWPFVNTGNAYLNVYGNVARFLGSHLSNFKNVNLIGFTKDLEQIYRETDIVINPVKAGAGLKIKNVEALGHGLPLITTTHGISGINDAMSSGCLLVADTSKSFIKGLNDLIHDFSLRSQLGNNAFNYAKEHFSHDICFEPITNLINQKN